jgi:hypothetical protein
VDLGVAGIAEVGAAPVGAPDRAGVGVLRVGGQVEDVAVAAGGQHHGVRETGGEFAGDEVAGDDPAGPSVDDDEVEHLGAGVHVDVAGVDLPAQGLVGADQQLLAGLAAGVEGALHLHAAERAGVEQAAVRPHPPPGHPDRGARALPNYRAGPSPRRRAEPGRPRAAAGPRRIPAARRRHQPAPPGTELIPTS